MNALKANLHFPFSGGNNVILVLISLAALLTTFFVSNSNLDFPTKLSLFAAEIFLYLLICALFYFRPRRQIFSGAEASNAKSVFTDDIEQKLLALEEAHQFFGSSLKSADMFRLAASRLNEIIPFATCAFFNADVENRRLKSLYAVGKNAEKFAGLELSISQGLAGKTFESKKAQLDERLTEDKTIFPAETLNYLSQGIAVPLRCGTKTFGVLVLYGDEKVQYNRVSLALLEAAAVRIAPLFLSSKTFENNLTNALTDSLTNMPNERAFYLVLENQIAEAQRYRSERPLTILSIDIKNFDEINRQFGHAAGDRILYYAAENIKNQLRQMDFLARSTSDEFLAVLPTASEEITREIVERVRKSFVTNPFEISRADKVNLHLNFGAASFGRDGETATALIKHARLKNQQSKSDESKSNVLWFSKEFVN